MRKAAAFLLLVCLTVFFSASAEEAGSFDHPGSIVRFGHFEQDNNLENGPEEIEWMVLDTVDGQSLLLSLYALDTRPFNETYGDITWEECTLRAWLNGAFYEDAFSETEKQAVVLNHTDNGPDSCCSKYGIPGGNDTDDHVFLLSYTQAATYFSDDVSRQCTPTPYALARGAHNVRHAGRLCSLWWFRSPGNERYRVSCSYSGGALNYTYASKKIATVRPVILVDTARLKP